MNRRRFLGRMAAGLTTMGLVGSAGLDVFAQNNRRARELAADVVIVGGGVGGYAAALAALRAGMRVIMTEETDWIGGQLTQQAVPPDEHQWIEQFGATRSYREFRKAVRDIYRRDYPLTAGASRKVELNPGGCGVSRICHEQRVALAALEGPLRPYAAAGKFVLLTDTDPVAADVATDRIRAVRVFSRREGIERYLVAPYFLDATELGDLLPLSGTEYVTGAESRAQTGELHAPEKAQPLNMQAITWCFAMEYLEGEDHTIEKPAEYDFWRDYIPALAPKWPGKLLSLTYANPRTHLPTNQGFDPRNGAKNPGLWNYRRLIDPAQFEPGTFRGGVSLVNWPQNDYWLGNIIEVPKEEATRHLERARQTSLSLFYWLQTEAPRPDGGVGWPGLRLRGDLTGTEHGLAKRPYIRESRRIKAAFTVCEQHVGFDMRKAETGLDDHAVRAASFHDSVGVGSYRIDLHPSTGGDNYIDVSSLPFEIPLGALIPQRMENLLPACKNLGVTHITNGCYRLHPVEWNIGEAAGALAAFCVREKSTPRAVRETDDRLRSFQRSLQGQGVELRWPTMTAR